jgi:hypothetical protein
MPMNNKTNIKVPKKYQNMIDEIYKDSEGYWAYSKSGFYFGHMGNGCHTAHEYSQSELLTVIRSLKPCECEKCEKEMIL